MHNIIIVNSSKKRKVKTRHMATINAKQRVAFKFNSMQMAPIKGSYSYTKHINHNLSGLQQKVYNTNTVLFILTCYHIWRRSCALSGFNNITPDIF